MDKKIVIYDADSIYAIRLMEYIKRRELGFEVQVFTENESFAKYMESNSVEILLLEESLPLNDKHKEKINYLCILSEQPRKSEDFEENAVFKYQSAENILAKVLTDYTKKENETSIVSGLNKGKVISLVSIPPNRNKFSFALSLAYLLSERRKVLFIPLDLLPIPFLSSMDNSNPALSEFIYYLKDQTSNIKTKLIELLSCIDRLSYLTGLSHGFDLLSITREEMSRWIEAIKNHADYDLIVFYLGCYAEFAIELFNQSDKVLVAMSDSTDEKAMIKELERQLKIIGIPTETEKFQRLVVPEQEWDEDRSPTVQDLKSTEPWYCAMHYADRL